MACELSVQVLLMITSAGTERLPKVDNSPVFWLVQHFQVISSIRFAISLPGFECVTARVYVAWRVRWEAEV